MSAAEFLGTTALFVGIESHEWMLADFQKAATYCIHHQIDTLFIKVFDGPNEWYAGAFGAISSAIASIMGKPPIPYGYLYGYAKGSDLLQELTLVLKYLTQYGACIGNIETEWDNNPVRVADNKPWSQILHDALLGHPGYFYASVLSDPLEQHQITMFTTMAPVVDGWLPEIYDDHLQSLVLQQFQSIGLYTFYPTLDLSQEFGANGTVYLAGQYAAVQNISLWEYGFALSNPTLIDAIVATRKQPPMIYAEVAHFPDVSQMEPGESEFACGYFAVATCLYAGQNAPSGTPEHVDQWVDTHGGINTSGVSIQDMHNLLKAAGLHFWDMDSTSISAIFAALLHKFPVILTIAEQSVYDLDLGGNPYAPNWQPSGNHVVVATGIAPDGNILIHDTASIVGGIFGKLASQPRRYAISSLSISWACIVQEPWLPLIQSGNPLQWSNGKDGHMGVPTGWKDDGTKLIAPNGMYCIAGIRAYVTNHTWDANNMPIELEHQQTPLEQSNPSFGSGVQQLFYGSNGPGVLCWRASDNLVRPEFVGPEIAFLRKAQDTLLTANTAQASQIKLLLAEITTLQAELLQAQTGAIPQTIKDDIAAAYAAVNKLFVDLTPKP